MNIYFLSVKSGTPPRGYWDQYLLEQFFEGHTIYEGSIIEFIEEAIVIIPGAYQYDVIDAINAQLANLKKCTVIVTSDEENKFDLTKLKHPNMRLFATYPHVTKANVTWLPIGYPPQLEKMQPEDEVVNYPYKGIKVYFSGQINHKSRQDMADSLDTMALDDDDVYIHKTAGFAQGLEHIPYYSLMRQAKVVPAPRGNISPDSFRLYEALECGAVPIPENPDFWGHLFTDAPFPVISEKDQWPGYIEDALSKYPQLNNMCQSWWMRKKQELKKLIFSFHSLPEKPVTVVMPISPIPSHPDTSIFEETYKSIRHHHPTAPLIITFDGVRAEQEDKRSDYEEHIRRVLWLVREDKNVIPYIFDMHIHQIGMMRKIIDTIETPTILYIEHDCPLVTDYPIAWNYLQDAIESGNSNLVRFHFESFIPKPHLSLMLEKDGDLMETAQWSQRPHLASTAFYKRILRDYFTPEAKCFIEDVMHGKVMSDFNKYGRAGWQQWRLHIYHPEGVIKRSYTTDGRAGDKKFDDTQTW